MLKETDLICYQENRFNHHSKLNFFLKKHSTKEGTWGTLKILKGDIELVFLNGNEEELWRHRLSAKHSLTIPPACWHKIMPLSAEFEFTLSFSCKPQRFFSKKYGLGEVHKDLFYVWQTYLSELKKLNILDVGCGSGRNLLYFALLGHSLTGLDANESALNTIQQIANHENFAEVQTKRVDLNEPLNLPDEAFNLIFSTVSIQFLQPERIPSLLLELQKATAEQGFHVLVFPIRSETFSLPASFTFLPEKEALYHYYQDQGWSILEYKESVGQLHKKDELGKPIQGLFGLIVAQKIHR
nr:SAM-dependent methyltransferase TehB [Legionella jordanis]